MKGTGKVKKAALIILLAAAAAALLIYIAPFGDDEDAGEKKVKGKELSENVREISAYGITVKLPFDAEETEKSSSGFIDWTAFEGNRGDSYIIIQRFSGEDSCRKALLNAVPADGDLVRFTEKIRTVVFRSGEKGLRVQYMFGDETFTAYSFSTGGDSFVIDHNTEGGFGDLENSIFF